MLARSPSGLCLCSEIVEKEVLTFCIRLRVFVNKQIIYITIYHKKYLKFASEFYALDENGRSTNAHQARKQTNYSCLECRQIVRIRGGPHRQRHFYHLEPTPSCRQHQKGAIHFAFAILLSAAIASRRLLP